MVEILLLGNKKTGQILCYLYLDSLLKNTRNEIVKKIRNMNFPKLQCEGLVTKHFYHFSGEHIIEIETKNIQIVSD